MLRAFRYLELHRCSCQYCSYEAPEITKQLVRRVIRLSRMYPRYGYRRIRDAPGLKGLECESKVRPNKVLASAMFRKQDKVGDVGNQGGDTETEHAPESGRAAAESRVG